MTWFQKDVQKREFDSTGLGRAVQYAFLNPSSAADNLVIAAQGAGVRIVVLQLALMASNTVSAQFKSATNIISCQFPFSANGGIVLPYSRHGWFQTNANEALNINLNGGVACALQLLWIPSA